VRLKPRVTHRILPGPFTQPVLSEKRAFLRCVKTTGKIVFKMTLPSHKVGATKIPTKICSTDPGRVH